MERVITPFDEVRRIVLTDKAIYPLDNGDAKEKHFKLCDKLDLITLSVGLDGRLEGFIICYRSWFGKDLDPARIEPVGDTVSVDVLYIRPDLRHDGETIKRIIKAAFIKNRDRFAGAVKLVFNRQKDGGRARWHSYEKFSKGFL